MADVTRILNSIERGEPRAAEELLPLVYNESVAVTPEDISPDDLLAFNEALEKLMQKNRPKAVFFLKDPGSSIFLFCIVGSI